MLLTITGAMSLAIWLYLLLARGAFWRMRPDVCGGAAGRPPPALAPGAFWRMRPDVGGGAPRSPAPSVTAVVPARNEADVVGRAMASLAAQQYAGEFHMILVDDASQDGTAGIARQAAPELRVIAARPLPPGWTGKMWAVAEGVRAAGMGAAPSDYLLLTDADIVHPPDHLAALEIGRAHV